MRESSELDVHRREGSDLLFRALRGELQSHWIRAIELSRLAARVWHRVPQSSPKAWREIHVANAGRVAKLFAFAEEAFAHVTPSCVLLENGMLVRAGLACDGCAVFSDLDILVESSRMTEVVDALRGCTGGELRKEAGRFVLTRDGLSLNVQSDLVARRWFPPCRYKSTAELLLNSIPIVGSAFRRLSTTDALLQMVVHSDAHWYVRKPGIHLHLDIADYLSAEVPDWDDVIEQARTFGIEAPLWAALLLPQALSGLVPRDVFNRLGLSLSRQQLIRWAFIQSGVMRSASVRSASASVLALLTLSWSGVSNALLPPEAWLRTGFGDRESPLVALHWRRLLSAVRSVPVVRKRGGDSHCDAPFI